MNEKLTSNPARYLQIVDDDEASALLFELGLIDKFLKNPSPAEPWFSLVADMFHPTHYIVGAQFVGFQTATENGYVVHCFPKSQYSTDQVKEWIAMYRANCDPKTTVERVGQNRPQKN